ncbi:hypothetical protein [Kitasatospora sp. NPDC087314]|uniref:hypothetical protein n=1 Tax=Kitasatospora sp. NPDC087314 TaxID=3364068 RepID=UPI00381FD6E2
MNTVSAMVCADSLGDPHSNRKAAPTCGPPGPTAIPRRASRPGGPQPGNAGQPPPRPAPTGRAARAKHTGLVKITFAVEPDLPPNLRVGVFAEPHTYEGWLRFSSGNGTPQSGAGRAGLPVRPVRPPDRLTRRPPPRPTARYNSA